MYLGIDLGTSEVKALVIDENNEIVATHSAPLTIQRPHPHWSEQSPQAWWEATAKLMSTLREKCGHHWQAIKHQQQSRSPFSNSSRSGAWQLSHGLGIRDSTKSRAVSR